MPVHAEKSIISAALLGWYDVHARSLPWRIPPARDIRPDPYRVWLSEVMLQQTTVAAVKSYFAAFTDRWPTLADLAAADDADVMAAWAGLGYYARARNLLACARAVMRDHSGKFPQTYAVLRDLPGLGDYTAASIAAIAFGEAVAVVDANVERVMARLCAIETPLPKAKAEIRAHLEPIVPSARPGDFAQAMMDLGATICTSRNPTCAICPLMDVCAARKQGIAETLPIKPVKTTKPERHGVAHWIERDGQVLLVRRPEKGLLGGMRALPGPDWALVDAPPLADQVIVRVRHVFTHFRLTLDVMACPVGQDAEQQGEFWPMEQLDAAGLPTLYAKAVTAILAQRTYNVG
jgi:A/G-specific adenine glycosylase